ncbi:MAG: ABC transporter permease [Bacteroidota bacterium]|nr:ABC transporter permease [Bacteroidota bacterium]
MIKNYFKIAFRNLWRNKAFTAINIFGLAIGIATCLVIMLFVQNELSYDRFNKKADQMVRVVFRGSIDGQKMKEANVMPPVAKTFLDNYPEVKHATRLMQGGSQIILSGDKSFKEDAFAFVDPNFFKVFTLPLIQGDASTALSQPNTIVITKEMAQKYFGQADPLGKLLTFKDGIAHFKVTGVIDKVPANSHFHFDFFATMLNVEDAKSNSFMTSGFNTYLVLDKGVDYKKLQAKLPAFVNKYLGPQLEHAMGVTMTELRQKGNDLGLYLQPLTDIHLHSDLTNDLEPGGDIRYVYIFSAIALFMLLIACINFMNLSTAGASKRAREVGIRKVLGSLKMELVRQFLIESILLSMIGLLLAIVLVYVALPFFNHFSGKDLSLHLVDNAWTIPFLLMLVIVTGIFAGSYPAFFLSSFKPVMVLKGKFSAGKRTMGLRSGLVVFQFFISIVLIAVTTIVYQQLAYIQKVKLGYDKNQVIILPETWLLGKNQEAFYNEILQDPRVENASVSGYVPAGSTYGNNFFVYKQNNYAAMVKTLRYDVDYTYLATLGMKMSYGRNFSKEFSTDSSAIILNETAAKALGWNKDAIDKVVSTKDNGGKETSFHVIGVVKDFHFKSLHELISPLVMVLGTGATTMIVKLKTKDIAGVLTTMKKDWASLSPAGAMSYSFLDDRVQQTYEAENKTGTLLAIFASLTIFIACLGLFGLVTFTAEQRTKEIGIRKVLGASVGGIVRLLSKEFLKLVFVAIIIATPVAWLAMNNWLQDFAYRINISWWMFGIAGLVAILIALFTVSFKAIKAAIANPVKSLRTE